MNIFIVIADNATKYGMFFVYDVFFVCCHNTLSNCMGRNVIVLEQCHICYNFTINCFFDGSGIKCNLFCCIDYIGCLIIARNVVVPMVANRSICDVQLFQFKKRKWNNLRFICDRIVHQSFFFFFLLFSENGFSLDQVDTNRLWWHSLEFAAHSKTVKHVYSYTKSVYFEFVHGQYESINWILMRNVSIIVALLNTRKIVTQYVLFLEIVSVINM